MFFDLLKKLSVKQENSSANLLNKKYVKIINKFKNGNDFVIRKYYELGNKVYIYILYTRNQICVCLFHIS